MTITTATAVAKVGDGRALPWRLLGFVTATAASCAGEITGQIAWDAAATLLFVSGLAIGWRHWLHRPSGRVSLLVTGGVIAVALTLSHDPAAILGAAARMSSVIVLMLCVALLRPIFADRQLDAALAATLARVPAALRPLVVVLAACGASLGLSFGAVGVAGATLGRRAEPQQTAACAAMRGLVVSMLLGPSVASVAAVMTMFPSVSWTASLTVGIPLALVGLGLGGVMAAPLALAPCEHRPANVALAAGILAAEFAATITAHVVLGLSMTMAISLASSVIALACATYWGRRDLGATFGRVDDQLLERWTAIMPETALFLSCGLLVGVMQIPELAAAAKSLAMVALPGGLWGIAAILFAVPLITVAGIHPLVPFAVLAPVMSGASLGITETGVYAMWIVMFMLSMLLSPISVLTMVTATSFDVPGHRLGLSGNGLYAAALAAAATVTISVCCAA